MYNELNKIELAFDHISTWTRYLKSKLNNNVSMTQCKAVNQHLAQERIHNNPSMLIFFHSNGWSVCEVLLQIWHQWAALPVCLEVSNAPLTCCSLLLGLPTARPANSYWHQRPHTCQHPHPHTRALVRRTNSHVKAPKATMLRGDARPTGTVEGDQPVILLLASYQWVAFRLSRAYCTVINHDSH